MLRASDADQPWPNPQYMVAGWRGFGTRPSVPSLSRPHHLLPNTPSNVMSDYCSKCSRGRPSEQKGLNRSNLPTLIPRRMLSFSTWNSILKTSTNRGCMNRTRNIVANSSRNCSTSTDRSSHIQGQKTLETTSLEPSCIKQMAKQHQLLWGSSSKD